MGYLDSLASKRKWYHYRVVAEDEAGNRAGSRVVKAKPINNGVRDTVQNLDGQLVGTNPPGYALIEWDYPKDVDLIGFQIFRGLDTNQMFSYRFFPMPLPATSDYSDMTATFSNNLWHCRFFDYDLDFVKAPVKTSFTYFYNSGLSPNLAVPPPPSTPPAAGSPQTYTIPNPASKPPAALNYWVMAKFADGSVSPVAGPLMINL